MQGEDAAVVAERMDRRRAGWKKGDVVVVIVVVAVVEMSVVAAAADIETKRMKRSAPGAIEAARKYTPTDFESDVGVRLEHQLGLIEVTTTMMAAGEMLVWNSWD